MKTTADSEEEAELLIFVVDVYLDGLPTAEAATLEDRSIDTPELLLDLMSGYDEQRTILQRFRGRLLNDIVYFRSRRHRQQRAEH